MYKIRWKKRFRSILHSHSRAEKPCHRFKCLVSLLRAQAKLLKITWWGWALC